LVELGFVNIYSTNGRNKLKFSTGGEREMIISFIVSIKANIIPFIIKFET